MARAPCNGIGDTIQEAPSPWTSTQFPLIPKTNAPGPHGNAGHRRRNGTFPRVPVVFGRFRIQHRPRSRGSGTGSRSGTAAHRLHNELNIKSGVKLA